MDTDKNSPLEGTGEKDLEPTESYEKYVKKYSDLQIKKITSSFEFDESSRDIIRNIALWVAYASESLTNVFTQDQLHEFDLRVSQMSAKYKENKDLLTNLKAWIRCRKNVIKILKSSAIQLDQNLKTANYGRLIGSLVELANSFDIRLFESIHQNIADHACNISPAFGIAVETAINLTPNLGYLGLVSCFGEVLWSKSIIGNVLKGIKEDMDKFELLQEFYNETDELNDSVKRLFPFGIDLNIVKSITESLPNLDTHLKVFSAIFISNVKQNQDLFSDGNFVSRVFLFCRSAVAAEWYNRIINREHPFYIESAKICFRNELRELVKMSPDSVSFLEIGRFSLKPSSVPRVFQAIMNGISLYSSAHDLKNGTKHSASEMLRDMAKSASAFLSVMENVRIRLSALPIDWNSNEYI